MGHLETFLQSTGPGASFAIATRDNPSIAEVAARVRAACGGAAVEVSAVFESTDAALSRHFFVRFPDKAVRGTMADRLDLGYALQDALSARSVDVFDDAPPAVPADLDVSPLSSGSSEASPAEPTPPEWHLANIRAEAAWAISRGAGILIGQPDTGVADHHLLTNSVSRREGFNLLEGGLPIDPLKGGAGSGSSSGSSGSSSNPGHGTLTASVAASRGNDADRRIRGVAPEAIVIPVRCVSSVILTDFTGRTVGDAIRKAVDAGVQVISISLGGVLLFTWDHVHQAIKYGAERGVVFVAAAGNGIAGIGGPAVYPGIDFFCACIAGSNIDDKGWNASLGGPMVTVSAPAENVWAAWRSPGDGNATRRVAWGSGTSYATAITGGVAALWIAHHGHANLIRRYRDPDGNAWRVTKAFQRLLRASARTPSGWNAGYYGAGIVDADKLLRTSLDEGAMMMADTSTSASADDEIRQQLRDRLVTVGAEPTAVARLDDAFLDRYGRELAAHVAGAEYRRATTGAVTSAGATLSQTLRRALVQVGAETVMSSLTA